MNIGRLFAIASIAFPLTAVACASAPGDEEVAASSAEISRVMPRKDVVDGVKKGARNRGITNTLLVAGIANHETNLAHCVDDYYVQQCKQAPSLPKSKSCKGGSVTIGNADGTCEAGGLGLFQIDRGSQQDTVAVYGPRVLEVEGNTEIGIDYILDSQINCIEPDGPPSFGPDPEQWRRKATDWINGIKRGTANYNTFFTCVARYYNGCLERDGCDTAARAAEYRQNTEALITEFGEAYFAAPSGSSPASGECVPAGLYCGAAGLPGGTYDSRKLYRCNDTGKSLSLAESCAEGCFVAPPGHDDRCIQRSMNWSSPDNESTFGARGCDNSRGTDGKQHWTCNVAKNGHPDGDGNLYRCEPDGTARYVKCTKGCSVQPINSEDYCE